jgi:hypothetical protein
MKKICIYLLLLFSAPLFGQVNLVPNPSFEDTVACPITYGNLDQAVNWVSATLATPAYFNSCASPNGNLAWYSVPLNEYGYQIPFDGNAYILLALFAYAPGNNRYYAEAKLTHTLTAGKQYSVSFRVSLTDSSNYACDDIGVYFSDSLIDIQNTTNLPFNPQIKNAVGDSLNNKTGWTLVSGIYSAVGTESWIIIGNFKPDSTSIHYSVPGGKPGGTSATVFMDSIVVKEIVGAGMQLISADKLVQVYPNPANDNIKIILNKAIQTPITIQLYNEYNQLVLENENLKESYVEINIADLPKGIYFLFLKNQKNNVVKKIIKL